MSLNFVPVLAANCKGYVFKTVEKLKENENDHHHHQEKIETLKKLCLYKITHFNQVK